MSRIDDNNDEIELYQESIDRLCAKMQKNLLGGKVSLEGHAKAEIDEFIKNANICYDESIPDDDYNKLGAQCQVTSSLKAFPCLSELINPLQQIAGLKYENEILKEQEKAEKLEKQAKSKEEKKKTKQSSQKSEPKEVQQEGHLYPVKLVSDWTEKLKQYNKQMDDFLADLDELSPTVDLTWLCKKIEAFCNKINFALAKLRYQIVKTLSTVFKQATAFTKFIDPIVNFNLAALPSVLGWAGNVISFFMKPYMTVITFISDFMSYTPPLLAEAGSLVGKAASVPVHALGIIDRVSLVADDKNGEKKEFAEAVKGYINIEVEPITLGDVLGGAPKAPKKQEPQSVAKAKELAEKRETNTANEVENTFNEFKAYILSSDAYPQLGEKIFATWPVMINRLNQAPDRISMKQGVVTLDPDKESAFIYRPDAAQIIFGKKYGKINVMDTAFNSRRYKMYGVWSASDFHQCFIDEPDKLQKVIESYYKFTFSNSNKKKDVKELEEYSKMIDFIKAFTPNFPRIPEFLDKMRDAIITHQQAVNKLKEVK